MVRRNALALSVLFVMLTLAACNRGPAEPTKGDVIVYAVAPLSGFQAEGGQTVVGGARLAAEQINRNGGLMGYRVKVVAVDDEADSDVAVGVAEEVRAAVQRGERVLGVIGHYNSGQTSAAMDIYKDLNIVVITPTASDVSLSERGFTNFFRVNATDATQAPTDARFLVEKLGAQRVAVVHANNDYGRGLRDQMVAALRNLGQEPAVVIEIVEAAESHAAAVQAIQQANPDAIFLAGYETEGYVLLPELRAAGVTVPFLCSDGCFLAAFADESGPAAEGAYVSAISPSPTMVGDETWWKAYQAVEFRNPGNYSPAGYSAMAVLLEGARRANSLDGSRIADTIRQLDYSTLVGRVRFTAAGDLQEPKIYIFQVQGGEFVQVPE